MQDRLGRWHKPILCLVVGADPTRIALDEIVMRAVAAGIDWLQLRERKLDGAAWLGWGRPLAEVARATARRKKRPLAVLVNRRVDLALALGADGVHLGFDALGSGSTRNRLGTAGLVGVSTHYHDEVDPTLHPGADYAQFAPIFDPVSKPATREAAGLEILAKACRKNLPVLAQGGIDASRVASVLGAGARGIAVTGNVLASDDPGAAVAALRDALDRG